MFRIIAQNYYNYYKAFAQADIMNLHEGPLAGLFHVKEQRDRLLLFASV